MDMEILCSSDLNNDDAAATVTIANGITATVYLLSIQAGYSSDPTAAKRLTVSVEGVSSYAVPIDKAGLKKIDFGGAWKIEVSGGAGIVVTLPASGDAGVVGDLNVFYRIGK